MIWQNQLFGLCNDSREDVKEENFFAKIILICTCTKESTLLCISKEYGLQKGRILWLARK